MTIFGERERDFMHLNGYVIFDRLIPQERCDAVIDTIWSFLERDRNNREDWYRPPEGVMSQTRTLELYHHQSMWDNRQDPRLHLVFSEILGTDKLWVSIDRVNMTPPRRMNHPEMDNNFIHWDIDTSAVSDPVPFPCGLQGILYLEDTEVNQGGFQCVPSIYRNYSAWVQTQPVDRNPRIPDITGYEVVPISGKKGDLLIWDSLLPHGNGHNLADLPRYAQYITMKPAEPDLASRQILIDSWRNNVRPEYLNYPYRDPRNWEQTMYKKSAALTPLGRKLLGLDSWF
jgi:hypothetical protein